MIFRFSALWGLCFLLILSAHLALAAPSGLSIVGGMGVQQMDPTTARYDFGTRRMSEDAPLEHTFTLRNDSVASITIDRLQSSCGCTTAFLADDKSLPLTVGPGGIVPVKVSIAPHRLAPGVVTKSVWVFTHGTAEASVLLEITGILQDDYVSPASETSAPRVIPTNTNAKPQVGLPAPVFTLMDTQGKLFTLASVQGHPATLFFFCGCPWCAEVAKEWGQVQRHASLPASTQTLVVFAGSKTAAQAFATKAGLTRKQTLLLPDPDSKLTEGVYNLNSCPRVFVLDSARIIRYTNDHTDDQPRVAPAKIIVGHAIAALGH
jgi:peroxiredoxin